MKKVKRVLLSLLAVTALVSVCLAPRASASMSSIFGSTGNGSTRPGSAQWQLPESSTIQQQESSQQENTQQSMSSIFGSTGNGSNRPGSAMWQQESIQQQSTQQQSTQQQSTQQQSTQQQESTQQEKIYQAVKDALSNAGSEDVAYRYLRTLVTEIAAQMKERDSATPHYEIEEKVVRFLKQSGTKVFDEMSLRKTIRQILAEAYPDAYTPDSHPDDRKRNDLLDKTLRQLVSQTLIQMNAANFSAQKETIAEGLINKIKENGFLISDEAALKQQILRLIEEMIPSDNDSGDGNDDFDEEEKGYEEASSGQPLFNGYTQGNSSIKNSFSNNEKELILQSVVEVRKDYVSINCNRVVQEADKNNVIVQCLDTGKYLPPREIKYSGNNIQIRADISAGHMYEVSNGRSSVQFRVNTDAEEDYFAGVPSGAPSDSSEDRFVMEKIDWADAKSLCIQCKSEVYGANVSDYSIRCINTGESLPIGVFFWSYKKIYIELDSDSFTQGNTYEISNGLSGLRFTVLLKGDGLHFDTIQTIDYRNGGVSNDGVLKMTLKGSQFNIPTFELSSSQKKPSVRHSISREDGKLKVSTEVEPTLRVEQIIQREGLDSNPFDAKHHEFSMPGNEVIIPDPKNESRTITVVSRGETAAVYEFLPGADLSDFDASGDLKWPAPEEHLKLAGWRWNQEGSDRWMEKPSVMPDENLVVTSLWWPEEYSVTCNGEKTWVPFGHDLYPPAVETPEGMVFDHWEWTVEGSTAVIDKPYTMPACNLIATPFWTPRAYCLTVNGAATQVLYGTALAEPAAPEAPEGHSFGGWKWTVGGAEAAKPAAMPACDVTAEPIWTRNSYTLTFIGNEDGTVLFSQSCYYGDTIPYPANPTREGMEFTGWSFNVGYTVTTMPACDVTATANWKDATPPTPEEPEAPMEYFVYYYRDDDLISQQSYPEGAQIVPPDGMWLWPENLDSKWIMPGYDLNIYAGSENPDAVS